MTIRNLDGRLAALEAANHGRCYVVRVQPGADRAAIDAEIAAHQARTGYRGPVVVVPFRPDTLEDWRKTYAPPSLDQ